MVGLKYDGGCSSTPPKIYSNESISAKRSPECLRIAIDTQQTLGHMKAGGLQAAYRMRGAHYVQRIVVMLEDDVVLSSPHMRKLRLWRDLRAVK